MIHGPSLAIGGAAASAALAAAFLGLGIAGSGQELAIGDAPPAQSPDTITSATYIANGSPFLGDQDAPVTLVEFGDYQCQACNRFFHSTEAALVEKYVETGKVRLVFKDFNIIGQDSISASHGAHCAGEQGLFWEYHDTLYENWAGENTGWASPQNLAGFAGDVGLDMQRWTECVGEGRYAGVIIASNNDARNLLELGGTPAFFVLGPGGITHIQGAQPQEAFERVIEEQLAAGGG